MPEREVRELSAPPPGHGTPGDRAWAVQAAVAAHRGAWYRYPVTVRFLS